MGSKQDGPIDDSTLTMFSMLDKAYDDQLQLHPKLPEGVVGPGIRIALERYLNLQGTDLKFRNVDDMEAFRKIKEEETECLQRHMSKISSIAYYHGNLKRLLTTGPKELPKIDEGIELPEIDEGIELPEIDEGIRLLEIDEGIMLLKLVRRVNKILPKSIEINDGILKHLAEHIEKTRQQTEKIRNLQCSADDFQCFVRERDDFATWASTVIPSSDAYKNLTSRYDEVVRKLGGFKDGFLDSVRTDREALEEELPALLTVTLGTKGAKAEA